MAGLSGIAGSAKVGKDVSLQVRVALPVTLLLQIRQLWQLRAV